MTCSELAKSSRGKGISDRDISFQFVVGRFFLQERIAISMISLGRRGSTADAMDKTPAIQELSSGQTAGIRGHDDDVERSSPTDIEKIERVYR